MNRSSKRLRRKLRACAGLAGSGTLAAAAALGLASRGNGAVVTIQFNDHISPNSQVSYDLDGDGDMDVTFRTGWFPPVWPLMGIVGARMNAEFLPTGCTFAICGNVLVYDSLIYKIAQPFQAGELISSSADGCSGPGSNSGWLAIGSSGPFFEPASPRYAGFSFITPGADTLVNNAWAQIAVTEPRPGEYELDVIAIGYETEPFTAVPAGGIETAVSEDMPTPAGLALQNMPNPFSGQTHIAFQLPGSGPASIRIYDAAGRLVRAMRYERMQKGHNTVTWDGRDEDGRSVPSGIYFCRLEALGMTQTRKMIVVE